MDINEAPRSSVLPSRLFMQNKKDLYCRYCLAYFSRKASCKRHENVCFSNKERLSRVLICIHCQSTFDRKYMFTKHMKTCNVDTSVQTSDVNGSLGDNPPQTKSSRRRKIPCFVEGCTLKTSSHKSSLIKHLCAAHQDVFTLKDKEVMKFSTDQEFLSWKKEEEKKSLSLFTLKNGQGGYKYVYYYCHHDGSGKLHSERKTSRRNKKGRVKCGNFCIAKMRAKRNEDGSVEVEYFPTHIHHLYRSKTEFIHHTQLPDIASNVLNQQIVGEVPPTETLGQETNSLTKKMIWERVRRQQLNDQRLHLDDAKAVFMLVQEKSKDNSVLIYKPFKENVVVGPAEINLLPNSEELFMFGMQTDRQLQLMIKFCTKILIVDETHGTNQYGYKLLTCSVADDNGRGWPVAHLISSKSDSSTLKFFFCILKSRLQSQTINCVITNDVVAIINGMNEGFGHEFRHILCLWHVVTNLKDNLRGKVSKELQDKLMAATKTIINEKSVSVFISLCKEFLKNCNENTEQFISYFQQNYLNRPGKWAMCFRNFFHGNVNTTGYVESFHNKLKKFYLKKVNKRLDDLISILYNMEFEDYGCRKREASVGFLSLPQHIAVRHQRCLLIADQSITEVIENIWEIRSGYNQKEVNVLVRLNSVCESDNCFCKCTNLQCLNLCSHLFTCSCADRHPLCRHIHKLQTFLTQPPTIELSDFCTLSSEVILHTTPTPSTQSDIEQKALVSRIGTHLQYLTTLHESIVTNDLPMPDKSLSHFETVLSNLILQLENTSELNQNFSDVMSIQAQEEATSQLSTLPSFQRPVKQKHKIREKQKVTFKRTCLILSLE